VNVEKAQNNIWLIALILVLLQHDYDSGPLINGYHGLALVCVLLMVSSIVSCLGLNTQDT